MFTQIYSMQTPEEALACIEAGADRIGLLVNEHKGKYPCAITEEEAKKIYAAVGSKAVKVLISVLPEEEAIIQEAKRLMPDVLHLCSGVFTGSVEFKQRLNRELPGVKLMESVGIGEDFSVVEDAKRKAAYADLLILDSVSATVPGVGAAGVTHDWDIDAQIVREVNIPCIEAGGLGPDNVAEAIERIHPAGVDSLTKTSIKKDGIIIGKDIEKVREFCRIAHAEH